MKVFISQPMSGLSLETIKAVREKAKTDIYNFTADIVNNNSDIEFIDNLQEDKDPETTGNLTYLGYDIQLLENADCVYFCKGWEKSRGCYIEFTVCKTYDIPMVFEGEF